MIYIPIALVAVIAAFLGYAATKPNTLRVERSASFKAPPERIFPLINDFREWMAWSPWEKLDPNLKRTYSGAASGGGSIYEWEGNRSVGKGRMEIVESVPPTKIVINLDFLKPFEAHNTTVFSLEPRGDSTHVSWTMSGPNRYVGKVMSVFFSMDKMIGGSFEAGLASLKKIVES